MNNNYEGLTVLIKLKQNDNFYFHIKGKYSKETNKVEEIYFGTNLFNKIKKETLNRLITSEKTEFYIVVNPEGNENSHFNPEFYKAELKDIIFSSENRFKDKILELPEYYREEMKGNESLYKNIVHLINVELIDEEEFSNSLLKKKYLNKTNKLITEEIIDDIITNNYKLGYLVNA